MLAPQDNVVPLPSMWQHTLVLMWPGRWVSHSYSTVHDESYCCMIKWSEWFSAALREEKNQFSEAINVLGTHRKIKGVELQEYVLNTGTETLSKLHHNTIIDQPESVEDWFFSVKMADCVHANCFLNQLRFLSLLLKRHDKGPFVFCSQWKWMWF